MESFHRFSFFQREKTWPQGLIVSDLVGNARGSEMQKKVHSLMSHTADGSEIRRSPVEVGILSHYLQGFSTIPGGARFLNHQQ